MESAATRMVDEIRRRLIAGLLPRDNPATVSAGSGHAERCQACDLRILADQAEYDIDVRGWPLVRFDAGCYAIWEVERRLPRT